jgi:hypothetical protein
VEKVEVTITDEERARQDRIAARPPLSEILNLHDFEVCLHRAVKIYVLMFLAGYREVYHARESMGVLLLGR